MEWKEYLVLYEDNEGLVRRRSGVTSDKLQGDLGLKMSWDHLLNLVHLKIFLISGLGIPIKGLQKTRIFFSVLIILSNFPYDTLAKKGKCLLQCDSGLIIDILFTELFRWDYKSSSSIRHKQRPRIWKSQYASYFQDRATITGLNTKYLYFWSEIAPHC